MEQYIRPIFAHHKLPAVTTIEPLAGGMVNPGFYVNQAYVIRFNRRDPHLAKYRREAIAYRLLDGVVPTPKLIAVDESRTLAPTDYIILERIAGDNLASLWPELSRTERRKVAQAAGELLARIHQVVAGDKFGRLENALFDTWGAYLASELMPSLTKVESFELLTQDEIGRIKAIFADAQSDLAAVTTPYFVHRDYSFHNINYHNGKITGVYDFEWSLAGDPLFDFQKYREFRADYPTAVKPFSIGYGMHSVDDEPSLWRRLTVYRLAQNVELLLVAHHHWGAEAVTWLQGNLRTALARAT